MTPKRIRVLRAKLGISQAKMAESLRLSSMMVYYWERGAHEPKRWDKRIFEKIEELVSGARSREKVVAILEEARGSASETDAFRVLSKIFKMKESK